MDQNQFYAIKVPFLQKETLKDNEKQQQGLQQGKKQGEGGLSIIGVVDASGSMSSWWEMLANFWNQSIPTQNLTTITFDSRPRLSQSPILSTRIRDHGGGGTEIVPAFEMMEKELQKIPIENNVTVIFISDGKDNNVSTIEKRMKLFLKGNTQQRLLNFICLGVQKGFPTNIAMNLRQLYHKGDPQIPAIYLIEFVSEQAFFNKFETMRKYFYPAKLIRVDDLINLFPFEEDVSDEVFEGQWVISKKRKINILVENSDPVPIEGFAEDELEVDDVVDLFRSWVQHLQVQFMAQQPNIKDKAADALLVMERMSQKLADKYKMNVFHFKQEEINDPNQPFDVRAKRNYVYKYGSKLLFFVEEARQLAKGNNPNYFNDFEAAKKLNIGTITGKHQQKALALKGITVEEFRNMRDEFQQIVINCKFRPINEQGQERSIVSLENQRDILSDSKLITEALKYVKSQYDFAETFPLIGHGIKVKRLDGCYVNPWIIQVEQFAQQNKIIDSAYLIKNNFKVELNTGGDKKEEINCILPLFHETDDDLQPILRSRIMKLLLTFMVQQNVDTLYEETYLALLANALLFMYKQPDSSWKKETLNLIYQTTKIVYMGTEKFENYLQKLFTNPGEAYLSKEEEYEDYVASSKPFIYLHYAAITQNIIKDFDAEVDRLIIYHFIREQYKHNWDINYYFRLSLQEQDKKTIQENMKQSFEKFISLKHFREAADHNLEEQLLAQFQNKQVQIELVEDKVFNKDLKLTLESIEGFYSHITNKKFDKNRYIHIIYQTLTQYQKIQQDIFKGPIHYDNIGEILHQLMQANKTDLTKGQTKQKHQLEREYLHYFYRVHMMTKPMSYEHLKEECAAKNIDVNLIGYNHLSGLSSNCCFSKECPYYLRTDLGLDFKRHIQTWGRHVPTGFHKFVSEQQSKLGEIEQDQKIQKIIEESIKKWKQVKKLHEQHPNVLEDYLKNILSSFTPKDYKADLPQQQLVFKQVKLVFPKKQKLNRGMGRPRGRGGQQRGRGGRGRAQRGGRGRGRGGRY